MLETPKVHTPDYGTVCEMSESEMGNQQEIALAWLAGIWDGEGSFGLHAMRSRGYTNISARAYVGMTDKPTIERAADILESHSVGRHIRTRKGQRRRRELYVLEVQGIKRLVKFIPLVLPYLVTKKEQAALVLEYTESRLAKGVGRGKQNGYDDREIEAFFRCRDLNQKGFKPNGARSSEAIREELERFRPKWAA